MLHALGIVENRLFIQTEGAQKHFESFPAAGYARGYRQARRLSPWRDAKSHIPRRNCWCYHPTTGDGAQADTRTRTSRPYPCGFSRLPVANTIAGRLRHVRRPLLARLRGPPASAPLRLPARSAPPGPRLRAGRPINPAYPEALNSLTPKRQEESNRLAPAPVPIRSI